MSAGLYGRVSGNSYANYNTKYQNGATGRNGNSTYGAPSGAVRLRGTVGKYNAYTSTHGNVEVDAINTHNTSPHTTNRTDRDFGCPTWSSGQSHPTHTFTVNSGVGATFTTTNGHTGQTNSGSASHVDATRQNVKMSDFYVGAPGGRVPDNMADLPFGVNYYSQRGQASYASLSLAAFRDTHQLPTKAEMKTAYQQLAGPAGSTYRYSGSQGANLIGNTLFTVNINVTDNPGHNQGVHPTNSSTISYFGSNLFSPQGGSYNYYGYGRFPNSNIEGRFTGNHSSYDNGTVANYHTSGSRYNTSINLDLWTSPKIGWGASDASYMTPQTHAFSSNDETRDNGLWKGFLQTDWTTMYVQHTAAAGWPSPLTSTTLPFSNLTVYAYDPYGTNFGYFQHGFSYSAGNSVSSKSTSNYRFSFAADQSSGVLQQYDRFYSYFVQIPTNIANIHRIIGAFYKNSGNIISLRTVCLFPGKFTFTAHKTGTTTGGTITSDAFSSINDNGYGFVLCGMGATRSPDSSMYGSAYFSGNPASRYRRLQVNADYWYDGALHEVGVLDTSSSSTVSAYVNPTGRMVSARGPYIDIGVPDEYQDAY